jgi:hypothetical protein
MSHDGQARRVVVVLICVAFMALLAGCRRSPFQRLAETDVVRQPVVSSSDSSQRPPITLVAEEDPQVVRAQMETSVTQGHSVTTKPENDREGLPIASAPTPLLDSVLKRVEDLERARREQKKPVEPAVSADSQPKIVQVSSVNEAGDLSSTPSITLSASPMVITNANFPRKPAPEPVDPRIQWKQDLERLKQLAKDSAEQPTSADGADSWRVRAQVVDWLSSQDGSESQKLPLSSAVATFADAMTKHGTEGPKQAAEIQSAVFALEDRVPLVMSELHLCRKIHGFGSFEAMPVESIRPGQTVLVYCELTGLRYEQENDGYRSRLNSRVELVLAKDGSRAWEESLGEAEDHCRRRRRDCFVNYRITLPGQLSQGEYRLRLSQTDMIAHASTSSELPLTIVH